MKVMKLKSCFWLIGLLLVCNVYAQELCRADFLPKASAAFDLLTQKYSEERIVKEIRAKNVRWVTNLMSASAVFYKATHEKRYLDMSEQVFGNAIREWKKNEKLMHGKDDFFALQNLALAYEILQDNDRLPMGADEVMIRFADLHFDPDFVIDNNQGQERALGFVRMCNLFPDAPGVSHWKEYVDKMWHFWYRNKDVDETATLYASIHLNDIINIAIESDKVALLKTPEIRRWFERYRDQQAPSGYMPEYGDDYFFAYNNWILVFEKMARLTGDASFRKAAWKLFTIGYPNLDIKYFKPGWNLRQACDWAALAEVALLPTFFEKSDSPVRTSLVTTRTNRKGKTDIPDQLLLRASSEAGTPFIMSDLYASGTHQHPNLRGTINYFEVDDNPLFHGVQRHATDVRHGNTVVLMKENGSGFPFDEKGSRLFTNSWFTDCVDFSQSTEISGDTAMRGMRKMTFRFQGEPGEEIYIKNVRLIGKAGNRLLHDCSTLENWSKNVTLVDLSKEGKAVKVVLPDKNVCFVNLDVAADFSLNDYRYIGCDWKHTAKSGAKKSVLDFMIRAYNKVSLPGEEYIHEKVGTLFNPNIVKEAMAETREGDSYGRIVLDDQCVDGSVLQRNMVLTKEGILVIQDHLLPGAGTEGYTAGSLWQLYSLDKSGKNWFNSTGENKKWKDRSGKDIETNQLLVYFEEQKGRHFGAQQQEYTVKPVTTFAKQKVIPGSAVTFVTIIVPHTALWKAEDIAKAISAQTDATHQSNVWITLANKNKLKIEITKEGNWKVERNE